MNTDISGPGVRLSFYLQTLFLSCLFARSEQLDEITGALYTLLSTNTAMAVTALILGFQPHPAISYHDALIVLYLLTLSGLAVFLILPSFNKFPAASRTLRYFSVVSTYAILALIFAVLVTAPAFGAAPDCNHLAVIALFHPISGLRAGRVAGLVLAGLFALLYTGLLINDWRVHALTNLRRRRQRTMRLPVSEEPDMAPEDRLPRDARLPEMPSKTVQPRHRFEPEIDYEVPIAWDVLVQMTVVIVLWALAVMNTELLIRWSHFAPADSASWQFGQVRRSSRLLLRCADGAGEVLPMFLLVQPLTALVNAFRKYGIRPVNCEPAKALRNE
ncbi:hypothetical protein MIND_00569900 [Mycena indigotica]|uniref:Uncharacterized protein n=1 Tax=Mycena indigotica TaxID=2126181 RepID=A0A8H6W8R5_9AGAR|nr:uncharacterized protein MIND_00569900 [Mycena indigotica]KAF7303414.1 hypothetical protein MIND_00569900 [Mycena indigotica]